MTNTSKLLIAIAAGTAVGAAVGTAVGILFAPAKGADTRKNIIRKGKSLVKDLTKKFECTSENVNQ